MAQENWKQKKSDHKDRCGLNVMASIEFFCKTLTCITYKLWFSRRLYDIIKLISYHHARLKRITSHGVQFTVVDVIGNIT